MKQVYLYNFYEPDCENGVSSYYITDKPIPKEILDYFNRSNIIDDPYITEDKVKFRKTIIKLIRDYNFRHMDFTGFVITDGVSAEVCSTIDGIFNEFTTGERIYKGDFYIPS